MHVEILYDVMQWPVDNDQRAFRAHQTLKTGVQDFIFSHWGTHLYLKFESYNLQSKNLVIKVLIFMSKVL